MAVIAGMVHRKPQTSSPSFLSSLPLSVASRVRPRRLHCGLRGDDGCRLFMRSARRTRSLPHHHHHHCVAFKGAKEKDSRKKKAKRHPSR